MVAAADGDDDGGGGDDDEDDDADDDDDAASPLSSNFNDRIVFCAGTGRAATAWAAARATWTCA